MKLKRIASAVVSGMMVLSMAACGGASDAETVGSEATANTETQDDGQQETQEISGVVLPNVDSANTQKTDETLVIALSSEPSTLYGAACAKTENEEQLIGNAIFDTLVDYDYATGEVEPCLATAWEWVDDTHLKFTLRDDVTMSDGNPLVAADVVYDVNEIWIALNATSDTGKYLVGAVADDEHTVTIEFTTAAPEFLVMMSWTNFSIVSESEVEAAGGLDAVQTNPVIGSGKYKFKEWKSGQSITLERNEEYWDEDYVGYYKEIVFTFTSDAAAREMAVESGDAQVAYDMPVSQAATFAESTTVNTTIYAFGQVTHLWYNQGDGGNEALENLKVRQAIDKALDFDAIAQVGTAGTASAADSYWDTTAAYYASAYTADERAVDIEGAKALLEEAGYGDGLTLRAVGLSDNAAVLTVMQANLKEVGIELEVDTPDTATFVSDALSGNYDLICIGDTNGVRIPANISPFLQWANVNGMIFGGAKWTTDEFDSLISSIITETDDTKIKEFTAQFDQMIKDQTVCSNLYSELKAAVYAKDLKGYNTIERGYLDVTSLYK